MERQKTNALSNILEKVEKETEILTNNNTPQSLTEIERLTILLEWTERHREIAQQQRNQAEQERDEYKEGFIEIAGKLEAAKTELKLIKEEASQQQQEINHLQIELAGKVAAVECLEELILNHEIKKRKNRATQEFVWSLSIIFFSVMITAIIYFLDQKAKK